jgi:PEP-CTERM motif
MRRSLWIIPALFLSAAIGVPTVHADTFNLTITGADTGSIAITESGGIISAITGTFDTATINSLLPVNSIGGNDNLFSPTQPYLNYNGVSFSLDTLDSKGYDYVNLYSYGAGYDVLQDTCGTMGCGYPTGLDYLTDPPVTTPEPGTVGLMLTGLGLLGLMMVIRKRTAKSCLRAS